MKKLLFIVVGESRLNSFDIQVHDTYFVIAPRHFFIGIGLLFGLAGGIYFFYGRLVKRPLVRTLGFVHFGVCALGLLLLYEGAYSAKPERYFDYSSWVAFNRPGIGTSVGFLLVLLAQVVFVFNLVYSAIKPVERGSEVG